MDAKFAIEHGAEFPYDGGLDFWNGAGDDPPLAADWAHAAARGVLADLSDRRGIKHELDQVDHDVRAELAKSLADIIRESYRQLAK